MLEQAVIDAEALKEAAVKNAEQTILEKYSTEIKDAVSSLLEQDEEDPFAVEDEMGMGGEEGAEDREGVVDQLDMIYWDAVNNTTVWKDTIDKVKKRYPKDDKITVKVTSTKPKRRKKKI